MSGSKHYALQNVVRCFYPQKNVDLYCVAPYCVPRLLSARKCFFIVVFALMTLSASDNGKAI